MLLPNDYPLPGVDRFDVYLCIYPIRDYCASGHAVCFEQTLISYVVSDIHYHTKTFVTTEHSPSTADFGFDEIGFLLLGEACEEQFTVTRVTQICVHALADSLCPYVGAGPAAATVSASSLSRVSTLDST